MYVIYGCRNQSSQYVRPNYITTSPNYIILSPDPLGTNKMVAHVGAICVALICAYKTQLFEPALNVAIFH